MPHTEHTFRRSSRIERHPAARRIIDRALCDYLLPAGALVIDTVDDLAIQRTGIDLHARDTGWGEHHSAECKARKQPYLDVALEHTIRQHIPSNVGIMPTIGWALRGIAADLLIYVTLPLGRAIVTPTAEFKCAVERHMDRWMNEDEYFQAKATTYVDAGPWPQAARQSPRPKVRSHTAISACVPLDEYLEACPSTKVYVYPELAYHWGREDDQEVMY